MNERKKDVIAEMLRKVSDRYNDFGGEGELILVFTVPVEITLDDGSTHSIDIEMQYTENGPSVRHPEAVIAEVTRIIQTDA